MIPFNTVAKVVAWKADDGDVVFSYLDNGEFQPQGVVLNALDENGRVCIPMMSEYLAITSGDCGEVEDSKLVDYNRSNPKYESSANLIVEFDCECGYGKVLYTDMTEQDFNDRIDGFGKFAIIVKDKWEPTKQTCFLTPMGSFQTIFNDCNGNETIVNKAISLNFPAINPDYGRYGVIWFENGELKCLVETESGDIK